MSHRRKFSSFGRGLALLLCLLLLTACELMYAKYMCSTDPMVGEVKGIKAEIEAGRQQLEKIKGEIALEQYSQRSQVLEGYRAEWESFNQATQLACKDWAICQYRSSEPTGPCREARDTMNKRQLEAQKFVERIKGIESGLPHEGPSQTPDSQRRALEEEGIEYTVVEFIRRAREGDSRAVKLFLDSGMNPNAKNEDGHTALMVASAHGYAETVKTLVDKHAEVNAKDKNGLTALMWACMHGQAPVVEVLLAARADINGKDKSGATALMWAAKNGSTAVVETMLAKGAEVNAKDNFKETALMKAAREGHIAVVEVLLRSKADVNAEDRVGDTAIDMALRAGHRDVIRLLKKAGAKL